MDKVLSVSNGYKTYVTCIVGILAILVNHFIGPIPGVDVDQANWLDQIWSLILVMCGRSAVAKVQPVRDPPYRAQ